MIMMIFYDMFLMIVMTLFIKAKSLVWEPEIQFWPLKYFESHVIEEMSKKRPKNLTSEILTNNFAAHYLINQSLYRLRS